MTNEQNQKKSVVENELWKLLRTIKPEITSIEYTVVNHYEMVTLTIMDSSIIRVNVTADSFVALCRDVLRRV